MIQFIGSLIGNMTDPVVFIPAAILGLVARSIASAVYGGIAVLAVVVPIKMPTRFWVAEQLGKPEPSVIESSFEYAVAISAIAVIMMAGRWVFSASTQKR